MTEHGGRSPREIWTAWQDANEAGDREGAGALALEMTRTVPGSFHAWFEAGLHSKAVRDWRACADRNARALELFTPEVAEEFDGANPAAWNLGIAATALGDWAEARRAWTAYGVRGLDARTGRIDVDLGLAPIRLNPDRPSLPLQEQPRFGGTEVVWCRRRSPAHAVVASVPLPDSGHRFGDVVLHDGEPKGTRRLGGAQVSVFDELDKLVDSRVPTWQAVVAGAGPADVDALGDVAGARGLGADHWSGIDVLCADCSHGHPDPAHRHAPAPQDHSVIGLAGPGSDLRRCLEEWGSGRPGVSVVDLQLVWG